MKQDHYETETKNLGQKDGSKSSVKGMYPWYHMFSNSNAKVEAESLKTQK